MLGRSFLPPVDLRPRLQGFAAGVIWWRCLLPNAQVACIQHPFSDAASLLASLGIAEVECLLWSG